MSLRGVSIWSIAYRRLQEAGRHLETWHRDSTAMHVQDPALRQRMRQGGCLLLQQPPLSASSLPQHPALQFPLRGCLRACRPVCLNVTVMAATCRRNQWHCPPVSDPDKSEDARSEVTLCFYYDISSSVLHRLICDTEWWGDGLSFKAEVNMKLWAALSRQSWDWELFSQGRAYTESGSLKAELRLRATLPRQSWDWERLSPKAKLTLRASLPRQSWDRAVLSKQSWYWNRLSLKAELRLRATLPRQSWDWKWLSPMAELRLRATLSQGRADTESGSLPRQSWDWERLSPKAELRQSGSLPWQSWDWERLSPKAELRLRATFSQGRAETESGSLPRQSWDWERLSPKAELRLRATLSQGRAETESGSLPRQSWDWERLSPKAELRLRAALSQGKADTELLSQGSGTDGCSSKAEVTELKGLIRGWAEGINHPALCYVSWGILLYTVLGLGLNIKRSMCDLVAGLLVDVPGKSGRISPGTSSNERFLEDRNHNIGGSRISVQQTSLHPSPFLSYPSSPPASPPLLPPLPA